MVIPRVLVKELNWGYHKKEAISITIVIDPYDGDLN